ncbi:hypothetical protein SAY87_017377 [Trapa incisa]|uniref:non-specific serine/threonine protein kinase n=1 Tax=Trapa incisa TaxID=236973 RepID=A0AAN7L8G0_9MYRT|nr:hypothetical protein SAY87_017377 [Trapa incisa]
MHIALVILLFFLQLLSITAYGFVLDSKECGDDRIGLAIYAGQKLFFINGHLVDKSSFCGALESYFINQCSVELPGHSSCGLDYSKVNLHLYQDTKLLGGEIGREPSDEGNIEEEGGRTTGNTEFEVRIGMAGFGIFAMCCIRLCPCFFRKKPGHTVLPKDGYAAESVSSEVNSSFEKIPRSPLRAIASPRHTPNSSRFIMSPIHGQSGRRAMNLNFIQVLQATQNFSSSMVIKKGELWTVYRGQLEDGQVVAIKRARRGHLKDHREVELLTKMDHQNLVKLFGFINKGDERLLVAEYVPNGTLRAHLDGRRGIILDFNQRLGIAIDVAHGLTYLHMYSEKQIIHRDVKSSNILLTDTMRAKVADFGFARVGAEDSEQSHVNTLVKGTIGYLDPEYMKTHQLTAKTDVFSFGILLLEILTGRNPLELERPSDERVTLKWAFKKLEEGNVFDLVDPRMEEVVDREILVRFAQLAILCAAPVRSDRPDMDTVGKQLWGIRAEYHKKP